MRCRFTFLLFLLPTCSQVPTEAATSRSELDGDHLWSRRFGDSNSQYGRSIAADSQGNLLLTGEFYGDVDFGGGQLLSAGSSDIFLTKLAVGSGNHLWSQRFGDSNAQYARGVAVDSQGNVLLTGMFRGTVDFGGGSLTSAGGLDAYIAKFDAQGSHLWSKSFGDANNQYGQGIAVDSGDNVWLIGSFYGTIDLGGGLLASAGGLDVFVAKFDTSGNHIWSGRFGDAENQDGTAIALDAAGNALLAGTFEGSLDFGGAALTSAGGSDIFLAILASDGGHVWSKRFGDPADQFATSVAADPANNVILTGQFEAVSISESARSRALERQISILRSSPQLELRFGARSLEIRIHNSPTALSPTRPRTFCSSAHSMEA